MVMLAPSPTMIGNGRALPVAAATDADATHKAHSITAKPANAQPKLRLNNFPS